MSTPMTASSFLFYISNLAIVSGYLFASMLITFRRGAAKDMSWRAWMAGLSFFLFCGLTHVELAIHAATGTRIIQDNGSVDFHMHLIHIPQAFSIWVFLWAMNVDRPRSTLPPVPLEGLAQIPDIKK